MKRSKLDDSQFCIPNGRTNGLTESTIQNLPLIREFNLSNIFKKNKKDKNDYAGLNYIFNTNDKGKAAKYEVLNAEVKAGKTYYIYANGATANILKISFATAGSTGDGQPAADVKASDGRSVKLSWNAVENGSEEVFYGVDTYVGDEKVDILDGISETETTIDRD